MNDRVYALTINPKAIDFAPNTEAEEILQNVLTICTTAKHTVPLDREFGVDGAFLDDPVSRVRAAYTQEVVRIDGKVYPRVFVKIVEL